MLAIKKHYYSFRCVFGPVQVLRTENLLDNGSNKYPEMQIMSKVLT